MKRNRVIRTLVGLTAVVAITAGAAQVGFAQDPGYVPTPTTIPGVTGPVGTAPAPLGSPERAFQLRRCIAKAKAAFGDNKVKRKAAIKKCKKRYGS
jgi:hypothetical protein